MGNIQYQIGLGEKIFIWHDDWAVDHLLATQFPDLFNCVVVKDAKVQDYLQIIGEQKVWSPILRINLKEHEDDQLISLLKLLIEVYIVDGEEDERRWNASKNGSLSVLLSWQLFREGASRGALWFLYGKSRLLQE